MLRSLMVGVLSGLFLLPAKGQVLDAFYIAKDIVGSTVIRNDRALAQTFEVEKTGNLTRVDVFVGFYGQRPDAPLRIDIRRLEGGKPSASDSGPNILGAVTLEPTVVQEEGAWIALNFPPVSVRNGERLALVLTTSTRHNFTTCGDMDWPLFNNPPGTYERGQALDRSPWPPIRPYDGQKDQWGPIVLVNQPERPSTDGGGARVDIAFKTYVLPNAPAWPMLLLALAGALVLWRLSYLDSRVREVSSASASA